MTRNFELIFQLTDDKIRDIFTADPEDVYVDAD